MNHSMTWVSWRLFFHEHSRVMIRPDMHVRKMLLKRVRQIGQPEAVAFHIIGTIFIYLGETWICFDAPLCITELSTVPRPSLWVLREPTEESWGVGHLWVFALRIEELLKANSLHEFPGGEKPAQGQFDKQHTFYFICKTRGKRWTENMT